MEMYIVWLILAGFFFILEISTSGFLVIWMAIGSLVSLVVSLFCANISIQISVFAIVSALLILCTRKLTDKIKPKETPSNVYTILGKTALVSIEIDNEKSTGQVKIDGDFWSARSEDGSIIPVDTTVTILSIDGVKVIVKKLN